MLLSCNHIRCIFFNKIKVKGKDNEVSVFCPVDKYEKPNFILQGSHLISAQEKEAFLDTNYPSLFTQDIEDMLTH
jgi:hypothetical protein